MRWLILLLCLAASPVLAAEYEIHIHPIGPVGGDGLLTCQTDIRCSMQIDLPGHKPLDVEILTGQDNIQIFFLQTGLYLPVQMQTGSKLTTAMVIPLDVFEAANPMKTEFKIYAPDAANDPIYPGVSRPKDVFINPVFRMPGALPVTVQASIHKLVP